MNQDASTNRGERGKLPTIMHHPMPGQRHVAHCHTQRSQLKKLFIQACFLADYVCVQGEDMLETKHLQL